MTLRDMDNRGRRNVASTEEEDTPETVPCLWQGNEVC